MVTTLEGILIPVSVVRTGDKNVLPKTSKQVMVLDARVGHLSKTMIKSAMATSKATTAQKQFFNEGKKVVISTSNQAKATNILTNSEAKQIAVKQLLIQANRELVNSYKDKLGPSLTGVTAKHKDFLASFTKMRWAFVNIAMIGALTGMFVKLIHSAEQFKFELARLALVSEQSFSTVRNAIYDVTYNTPESIDNITTAIQEVVKSGFSWADSMKIINASTGAALIGFASLGDTSKAVSQVLMQFELSASRSTDVAYKLAAAAKAGRVDIETMGNALKYSGGMARQAGTSFEELIAVTAILSNKGLQLNQIGRGERQFFLSLLSPTAQASSLMNVYGIELESTGGRLKSFLGIIREFEGELENVNELTKQDIIGKIFPANASTIMIESMGKSRKAMEELVEAEKELASKAVADAIQLQTQEAVKMAGAWQRAKVNLNEFLDLIATMETFKGVEYINKDEVVSEIEQVMKLGAEYGGTAFTKEVEDKLKNIKPREALGNVFTELDAGFRAAGEARGLTEFYAADVQYYKSLLALFKGLQEAEDEIKKEKEETIRLNAEDTAKKVEMLRIITETGVVYNDLGKRTESYNDKVEAALSAAKKFQKDQDEIIKKYGNGIVAAQIINQLAQETGAALDSVLPGTSTLFDEYVSALKPVNAYLETLKNWEDELKLSISDATDEVKKQKDALKELNSALSETKKRITELSNARFTGETQVLGILKKAELFRKQQELSSLGVADAEQFIVEALKMESSEYDTLFAKISKINSAMEDNSSAFDAWQESIKTAIRAEVEAGQSLGADVTGRVKTWQTALMGIGGAKGNDSGENTQLDDYVNKLQLAYDVHFGGMKDNVSQFLAEQKDREMGVFDTSSQLITALQNEMSARDTLIGEITIQEEVVKNATDELDNLKTALESVITSMTNYNALLDKEILNRIEAQKIIESLPTPSAAELAAKQSLTPTTNVPSASESVAGQSFPGGQAPSKDFETDYGKGMVTNVNDLVIPAIKSISSESETMSKNATESFNKIIGKIGPDEGSLNSELNFVKAGVEDARVGFKTLSEVNLGPLNSTMGSLSDYIDI